MTSIIHPLSNILDKMLNRTIRMEGFLNMMQDNCKSCPSFPDHYPELKRELDEIMRSVEKLIEILTMGDK